MTQQPQSRLMLRVTGLGCCSAQVGRRQLDAGAQLLFPLLLFMAINAGTPVPRSTLLDLFWFRGSEYDRKHAMRQQFYKLRAWGFHVEDTGAALLLDRALVECDLLDVQTDSWWMHAAPSDVLRSSSVLPGLAPPLSQAFSEWLDTLRSSVERNIRRAALRLAAESKAQAEWALAERLASACLASDPLNEEATLTLAECAAMTGSKTKALEIIDRYIEEIGGKAGQIALPADVLRRRIAEMRPHWTLADAHPTELVGREQLISQLSENVRPHPASEFSATLLWGTPGIGKTRVAHTLSDLAQVRGIRVIHVRCEPEDLTRPLSVPLALIPTLKQLPGAAGCSPSTFRDLDTLARLGVEGTTRANPFSPEAVRERVVVSLVELLRAVLDESRLLILVDDFHNADNASREAIKRLLVTASRSRVHWLFTSRSRRVLGEGSAAPVQFVRLPALTAEAAATLAQQLLGRQAVISPASSTLDRIVAQSAGNPLFIRSLCRVELSGGKYVAPAASLSALLSGRVEALSARARRVLIVCDLLGSHATVRRVTSATHLHHAELAHLAQSLEDADMLSFTEHGTFLIHDSWREAISRACSRTEKAPFSLRLAEALRTELAVTQDPHLAFRAARLFELAGERNSARALFISSGRYSLLIGFPAEAAISFRRAVTATDDLRERGDIRLLAAESLFADAAFDDCVRECDAGIAELEAAGHRNGSSALRVLALAARFRSAAEPSVALSSARALAADASLSWRDRASACLVGMVMGSNLCDADAQEDFYIIASSAPVGDPDASTALSRAQLIYFGEGRDIHRALEIGEELVARAREDDDRSHLCTALRSVAWVRRHLGDLEEAGRLFRESADLSRCLGLSADRVAALEGLAQTLLDAGHVDSAEQACDELVDGFSDNAARYHRHIPQHLSARIALARFEPERAWLAIAEQLPGLSGEPMLRKRIALASLIAAATAESGRVGLSTEIADWLLSALPKAWRLASFGSAVEHTCRALVALGRLDEAKSFAEHYLTRGRCEGDQISGFSYPCLSQLTRSETRSAE